MDSKLPKVMFEGDPRRCQATIRDGQCPHTVIEGTTHCERHTSGNNRQSRDPLANYQFSKQFHGKIKDFAECEDIKSLRGEIGVLRLMLQSVINNCNNEDELTLQADRITRLVGEINKCVVNCQKLEESTGQLLDKTVVVNIGAMIVGVIDKYVPDKALLDVIGQEIYANIDAASRPENQHGAVA